MTATGDPDLLRHEPAAGDAELTVDPDTRGTPVEPFLFGKFCEHLGTNVYHGMEAQLLVNPTFGRWHVRADDGWPDGGVGSETDPDAIRQAVEERHRALAVPGSVDGAALVDAYEDGLALGWLPVGGATASPDTGPSGERAQRIDVDGAAGGLRQATKLPLHRVRGYEFRCRLRATDPVDVTLTLALAGSDDGGDPLARAELAAGPEWRTVEGTLALPDDADPDGVYDVSLTVEAPASVVVDRLLLYPADHVEGADPEVIERLRESDLPLLRWPGGNFASGYHWRDGVGPVEERPTRPNPAWDGLEPNLFGTDEFLAFCERVGCEPVLCVNAGDGTPAEAARWVEYCNGSRDTEMGALRAENGHPEPYGVTHWEVGNELYGGWQVRWTTAEGNADRYRQFREAMLEADPSIRLTACGNEVGDDAGWNDTLLERAGSDVRALSEHLLTGGRVDADTDPDELFRGFLGFSAQLDDQFRDLRARMRAAGVADPRLDVTELQLFASFAGDGDSRDDGEDGLSPETMPTPETITEALYDATIRHACARLGGFVGMLTHSATVNHGGGLRKAGERVWANPCHHSRAMGAAQAGDVPVGVDLVCPTVSTETVFGAIDPVEGVPALDAMATVGDGGTLRIVVVNRATRAESIALSVDASALGIGDTAAEVVELSAPTMHARNTRDVPERITPETRTVTVREGEFDLAVPRFGMLRVTVPGGD